MYGVKISICLRGFIFCGILLLQIHLLGFIVIPLKPYGILAGLTKGCQEGQALIRDQGKAGEVNCTSVVLDPIFTYIFAILFIVDFLHLFGF